MWVMVRTAYSLSGVSAPFTLAVLNIQLFSGGGSLHNNMHTPSAFVPRGCIILFLCLLVNCNRVTLVYLQHTYLNWIVPKATDDLVIVILETVNSFTIFWATLNPLQVVSSAPPIRFNSLEEKQTPTSNTRSGAMVQKSQSSYIMVLEPTQMGAQVRWNVVMRLPCTLLDGINDKLYGYSSRIETHSSAGYI